jgi:uncharacterized coiled-coil protein SlyX
MKRISTLLACILLYASLTAQTPQSFSYQAVARDASGNALATKTVGLQLSVLDGSATGTVVYVEKFSPVTNNQGLFTVAVGTGTPVIGSFATINWSTGNKYLKTELDPAGGNNFTIAGTSELLSVPYAFYAASTAATGSASPWNTSGADIINSNTGDVGIATGGFALKNILQIGNPPGFSGNVLAMGDGANGMSFGFLDGSATWFSNIDFSLMPASGGNGYLGIGVQTPVNKVQIGNPPNFIGNDLAIGNGTQGTSFALSSTATTWYSNTNFALMAAFGGAGNVGIGVAPVSSFKLTLQPNVNGSGILIQNGARTAFEAASGDLYIDNGNASVSGTLTTGSDASITGVLTVSPPSTIDPLTGAKASLVPGGFIGQSPLAINASGGDVWGAGFYATSDARVKTIIGPSNAAADLKILNHIQVTDYCMKDTLTTGHRIFKKVIAQQVEEIYPQIIRRQRGFVPNVYQVTAKMVRVDSGYLLSFNSPHHLSPKAATIRIEAAGTTKPCSVLKIPSDHEVIIKSPFLNSTRAFVYGEEVDDFRSVDYEGLTTLNISATQELSKLVKEQAETIARLNTRLRIVEDKLKNRKPSSLEPSSLGR